MSCVACAEEVARLQRAAGAAAAMEPPERSAGCLDDHEIAALADGSLPPDRHRAILPHVRSCAACQSVVGAVAAALADPEVAREKDRLDRPGRAWAPRLVLPIAAAMVLLLAWPPPTADVPSHRGPVLTAGSVPSGLSPQGRAAPGTPLRWRSTPGADAYRVVLFDETGQVLFEHRTADTTTLVPGTVRLAPGRLYLWRVDARIGWDRWSSSEMVSFRVAPPDGE